MDKYLKCDLHMHSSSCYSRKYSEEQFIKKMDEVDLDVFAITDHNVVDVNLYRKLEIALKGKKKIIGGVELNLSLENIKDKYELITKGNYFHAVVWFSLEDIDVFWNKLKSLIIGLG